MEESCNKISEVANHINEEVRRHENAQRVEEMARKGIDIAVFIQPSRYLVKDGLIKVQVLLHHVKFELPECTIGRADAIIQRCQKYIRISTFYTFQRYSGSSTERSHKARYEI